MIFVTKLEDPDIYLKGLWAKENEVTKIILVEEGQYVNKTFTDKKTHEEEEKRLFEVKVQCNGKDPKIKVYSPNNTSIKKLMELGNGDTKNLIGKELPIITSFSNDNWIIYIDPTYRMPVQQNITSTQKGSDPHDTS